MKLKKCTITNGVVLVALVTFYMIPNRIRPNLSHSMMASSNGNIFRVTGPLCGEFIDPGEFPSQRPVTRNFHIFLDLTLNIRLNKQPIRRWFGTPSRSLWRHNDATLSILPLIILGQIPNGTHYADIYEPIFWYFYLNFPESCSLGFNW